MQRVVLSSPWPGELLVGVDILWQLAGWLAGKLAGWLLGLADWQSVCVACGEGFPSLEWLNFFAMADDEVSAKLIMTAV